MPRITPEKVKLEAICYTIAGLLPVDIAKRLPVSARSISDWSKDRILRAKAMQLYKRAVEDARASRRGMSRKESKAYDELREAHRLAHRRKSYRVAKAVAEAKDQAAMRKTVVVNQHPVVLLSELEEEEQLEMVERLAKLSDKFKVVRK